MQKIVEQVWDYTKHAKFYEFRPNYAPATIDMLVSLVQKNQNKEAIKVADIGAGTGNLSIMLLERGCEIERTKGQKIEWVRATGIDSTLQKGEFDWVTFGSSFNVMDRVEALKEAHRLLKPRTYFSCMWNHRDLNDPIQKIAEDTIIEFVPHYTRGVRRENQRPIIESHKELFDNIIYIEEDFYFHQSLENYIKAWRSVKNPYWDLETKEGEELFNKITDALKQRLPQELDIKYTTRCWSAKRV